MSSLRHIRPARAGLLGLFIAVVAAAAVVAALGRGTAGGATGAIGQPPPEWPENPGGWPAHNYDLSNTRATTQSSITAANVATLKRKWWFKLPYVGAFGAFTSNPVVLNGVVYLEDPDSNVYALKQDTGAVMWKHLYHSITPSGGPNGVAVGYGKLFGATEGSAFALNPATGKQLWAHKLIFNKHEGITMAPQLFDGKVLISTIPGSSTAFYQGGAWGRVYALDAATGKTDWVFSTVKGGKSLWGNAKVNSGGGIWYPPAVDASGRVFLGIANPAPWPGTKKFPNGSSRPGPNLYTDAMVALNGATGKLLWYHQVTPHDLRDYDFQASPIVTTLKVGGTDTEVVIGAGKSGKVVAFRADNGKEIWSRNVGKHQFDSGPLPAKKAVCYYPGATGGVETPMALSGTTLYTTWVDLCFKANASGLLGVANFSKGTGGIAAIDATTGAILWKHPFKSLDVGAATVANDVVFTSTYSGTIYAFDAKTGKVLWTSKAPAGINSFPAITKNMVLIGAGASNGAKKQVDELVAYSLPASATTNRIVTSGATRSYASAAKAKTTAITVKGGEFFFHLTSKTLAKPGTVKFTFKNTGHVLHDFRINGKQTPLVQPGKSATLTVSFKKKGSFPYLCTVMGHAAAGMKGTFTVK